MMETKESKAVSVTDVLRPVQIDNHIDLTGKDMRIV